MEPRGHKVQVVGVRPFRRGRREWVRLSDSGLGRWRTPGPGRACGIDRRFERSGGLPRPSSWCTASRRRCSGWVVEERGGSEHPKPMTLGWVSSVRHSSFGVVVLSEPVGSLHYDEGRVGDQILSLEW